MSDSANVSMTMRNLITENGPAFVDDQLRRHLLKIGAIGEGDSLAALMVRGRGTESAQEQFDFTHVEWWFAHPRFYSKPVMDASGYTGPYSPVAGAWHFEQANGWDSWFNFVVRPDGGFYVLTPAARITGSHKAGIEGNESVAACIDSSNGVTTYPRWFDNFCFVVQWTNGTEGEYQCSCDPYGTAMTGTLTDRNTQQQIGFTGSRTGPSTKLEPGGWPVSKPALRVPTIEVTWVVHANDWLYDEVVTGTGFIPGDEALVFFNGNYYESGQLGSAVVDDTGGFVCHRYGRKLNWSPLTYFAFGEISGYTGTVWIDSTAQFDHK
ncbi:hypothetical protein [Dyella sp. C11]|uniref:hypothetical protein n=1 Tax=Dyella sp. C11 TaxID=2126991 RepID=UPI000D65CFF6|nr:hypothetical protein [Dyella sp. C11]